MGREEQDQAAFEHELRRIAGVSEDYAEKAWYSIRASVTLSPEKQARIYVGLYGLSKEEGRR